MDEVKYSFQRISKALKVGRNGNHPERFLAPVNKCKVSQSQITDEIISTTVKLEAYNQLKEPCNKYFYLSSICDIIKSSDYFQNEVIVHELTTLLNHINSELKYNPEGIYYPSIDKLIDIYHVVVIKRTQESCSQFIPFYELYLSFVTNILTKFPTPLSLLKHDCFCPFISNSPSIHLYTYMINVLLEYFNYLLKSIYRLLTTSGTNDDDHISPLSTQYSSSSTYNAIFILLCNTITILKDNVWNIYTSNEWLEYTSEDDQNMIEYLLLMIENDLLIDSLLPLLLATTTTTTTPITTTLTTTCVSMNSDTSDNQTTADTNNSSINYITTASTNKQCSNSNSNSSSNSSDMPPHTESTCDMIFNDFKTSICKSLQDYTHIIHLQQYDPISLFFIFIQSILCNDVTVLMDMLCHTETSILKYLLRITKYILTHSDIFQQYMSPPSTMNRDVTNHMSRSNPTIHSNLSTSNLSTSMDMHIKCAITDSNKSNNERSDDKKRISYENTSSSSSSSNSKSGVTVRVESVPFADIIIKPDYDEDINRDINHDAFHIDRSRKRKHVNDTDIDNDTILSNDEEGNGTVDIGKYLHRNTDKPLIYSYQIDPIEWNHSYTEYDNINHHHHHHYYQQQQQHQQQQYNQDIITHDSNVIQRDHIENITRDNKYIKIQEIKQFYIQLQYDLNKKDRYHLLPFSPQLLIQRMESILLLCA